ncbi:MAG: tail fiber domain-containing protein [Lachnospiraceae bacterium]|nr:tail fiber domain-containing protein [Lachnospiraceae bacterium]
MNYFGLLEQDITLINDDMIVEKTIQVEEGIEIDGEQEKVSVIKESALSGKDVITAICELSGCFGHIGRNGKFHYIYLEQDIGGVYPSDKLFPDHAPAHLPQSETGHLYPQGPKSQNIDKSNYIECHWEDFWTKRITKIQIRQEENDIGVVWPEGKIEESDNCYVIENNFLLYGKSTEELKVIAKNIFEKISNIVYRPFDADIKGNPCFEVGDAIRIPTKYDITESYILQRTLKGLQSLRDGIKAEGSEKYAEKVNGVQNSIIQLKGKANVLFRNIEETRSTITDVEKGLKSEIKQTAEDITSTVSKSTSKYDTTGYDIALFGYLSPPDGEIPYEANEHNEKYYLNQSNGKLYKSNGRDWRFITSLRLITENLSSEIKQTAEGITQEVAATYETKAGAQETKNELSSKIEQTAEEITSTVSSAVQKYDTSGFEISLFGYISPPEGEIPYKAAEHPGEYYLNQDNGKLYLSRMKAPPVYEWILINTLNLITENLSSEIKQTAEGITQTIAGSERLWDAKEENGTEISIQKYGYGPPPTLEEGEYVYGLKYLDQSSGIVYMAVNNYPLDRPPHTDWRLYKRLQLISASLESRIAQTLTGIELGVKNNDTGAVAGITIKITKEDGTVFDEGEIVLTGLVTITDLRTGGSTVINGDNITAGTINGERINTDTLYLNDGLKFWYTEDGIRKTRKVASLEMVPGQTYPNLIIGGTSGSANLVSKNSFNCVGDADFEKEVYFRKGISVEGGSIDANRIYLTAGIQASNIGASSGVAYMLLAGSNGVTVSVGFSSSSSDPTTTVLRGNTVKLASAGSVTTSDERLKNSFKPLDEFDKVYMDIDPCAFRYNNGTSGRYHFGVKAQNVKDSFEKHGYSTSDFGGFVQMSDDPQNEDYSGINDPMGIIYTEFTMWNTHMVQKLYKKVEELEKKIFILEKGAGNNE